MREFLSSEGSVNKVKRQSTKLEKIIAGCTSYKGLMSTIRKILEQLNRGKKNQRCEVAVKRNAC